MLAAFANPAFRLALAGTALAAIGEPMEIFAIGWLLVELAGRDGVPHLGPLYIGLASLGRLFPTIALGLYAGAIIDRLGRRVVLWSNGVSGAIGLVLGVLVITNVVSVWMVILVSTLSAGVRVFDTPGRLTMSLRIVPTHQAVSAIGLFSMLWHLSSVIGPLIGGLLIIPFGVGGVLLGKAFGNLLSHVLILHLPPPDRPAPVPQRALDSIREAFGFVRREPVLLWVVIGLMFLSFAARPALQLLPAVAKDLLAGDSADLSRLLIAASIGTLCGSLMTEPISRLSRRGVLFAGFIGATGVAIALLSQQRTLAAALLAVGIVGLLHQAAHAVSNGLMVTQTPERLLGRIMSAGSVFNGGPVHLGTLGLGALATAIGLGDALLVAGALTLTGGAFLLLPAALRRPVTTHESFEGRA